MSPELESSVDSDRHGNGQAPVSIKGLFRPWMIVLGLLIMAAYQFHFINFTWDDPFISFRYAENLANGKGLVFNEGERVEGYSNLLYVLIFAAFYKLNLYWGELRLVYPAKILGFLTSVAVVWLMVRYAARIESFKSLKFPKAVVIIGFLAVSNIFLHIWAMCGMETIFFPFLILIANLFLLKGIGAAKNRSRLFAASGFIFFLACITRPDGFIMAFAAILFAMFTARRGSIRWKEILPLILAWIIPSLMILLFRYFYYHDILPMSYYSKATGGWPKVVAGAHQWWFGISQVAGHWIIFAIGYLPIFLRRGRVGAAYYLIFIQTLFYQVYIIYSGFDFLWANRFFTHMLPMIELMIFAGICDFLGLFREFKPSLPEWGSLVKTRKRAIGLAIAILAVLGVSGNSGMYKLQHWDFSSGYVTLARPNWLLPAYYKTGIWMKENLEPTDRVAMGDIGAIPYISGVQVLDCFGLADSYIAKLPGDFFYKKYDIDYILGEKPGLNEIPPDYIILMGKIHHLSREEIAYNPSADKFEYMVALWRDARFHENYELIKEIDFFLVFKRRGLGRGPEQPEDIRKWFPGKRIRW